MCDVTVEFGASHNITDITVEAASRHCQDSTLV